MTSEDNSEQNTEGRLVSRAEIAALAGVRRSAITNWERRHADFPIARRAGEQDYYRLSDVVRWLDTRQVSKRDRRESEPEGVTYGDRVRASPPWRQLSSPGGYTPLAASEADSERARSLSGETLAVLLERSMARRWGARSLAGYASAKARKNYAGTSPITRASGKVHTVQARYVRNNCRRAPPRTVGPFDIVPGEALAEDARFDLVRGCPQHAFHMFVRGFGDARVLTCGGTGGGGGSGWC
ncbi:hypothetical protein M2271_007641 [Streptomyces sp. LBL]|uniref:helix-turn-helix transcriptional regulator n=1 Tax=Streptomyces sp. LBL TaxID=2940562 RepID=UPI00247468E4|nr:hypothetical protein [Streptomyces sp. LBL]MDH6629802.1 hypothetical protein [Streptomyces sp. LBL]